ncbi:MAG: urease accessory protein UreE [Synechococcaceae cyanobacterium]|jgi:urease accessory protein
MSEVAGRPGGASPPEEALVLLHRLAPAAGPGAGSGRPGGPPLQLRLTAEERTRLRGLRHSVCGRPLLLQLQRQLPLQPGEWLLSDDPAAPPVQVEAAAEAVLVVRAGEPLALLQAAYHLGNRHVALQVQADRLILLADPVLAELLRHRGLQLEACQAPFLPEGGAYGHHHG